MHDEVQSVFREVFDDDQIVLTETTDADDIDGWDSLMHINLIIALERRFKISFATAEISGLKAKGQNVGTLLQLLRSKIRKNQERWAP